MYTYRRLIENNEWEMSRWHFWLLIDGNNAALDHLAEFIAAEFDDEDQPAFMFTDDVLTAEEVDLLVRFADEDLPVRFADGEYIKTHNKIDGALRLPEDLDDAFANALYKGGIKAMFMAEASS